jgi:hypothetical protein
MAEKGTFSRMAATSGVYPHARFGTTPGQVDRNYMETRSSMGSSEVCLEFCSDSSKGSKKGMSKGSNKGTIRVTIHPYPVYTYYYVPRTKCCINVAGNRFSNATCKSVKLRQFSNSICSLEPNPRNMSASSRRSEIIGGLVCSGKLPRWFLVKPCPRPFYG